MATRQLPQKCEKPWLESPPTCEPSAAPQPKTFSIPNSYFLIVQGVVRALARAPPAMNSGPINLLWRFDFAEDIFHGWADFGGLVAFAAVMGFGSGAPAVCGCEPVSGGFEDAAGDTAAFFGGEPDDEWRDVFWGVFVEGVAFRFFHHVSEERFGHLRTRDGGDGVGGDAVATELCCLDEGEGGDTSFGGAVVCLCDATVEAGAAGGIDDTAADFVSGFGLCAPVCCGVFGDVEVSAQVDGHDGVPVVDAGGDEHFIAQVPGVVHDDVQVAELADGGLHHICGFFPARDVGAVGDGLSAECFDLFDDITGGAFGSAEVVDDDFGAFFGERKSVRATQTTTSTGNDDHASFDDSSHENSPLKIGYEKEKGRVRYQVHVALSTRP